MKIYEVVFICKKNFLNNLLIIIKKIKNRFNNKILHISKIGNRKLAYEINGLNEGYYFIIFVKQEKIILNYIKKKIKYKNFLLRYIFIKNNLKNILKNIIE
ncbi:30S ribosomal protein S6 [Candidatus Vidania fulgoroideorum]